MKKWYQIREQSAGKIRLELLWLVYRVFGIKFLKGLVWFVCLFITPIAGTARKESKKYRKILNDYQAKHNLEITKFSSFSHIYTFAAAAVDKMSANCDEKPKIKFEITKNRDWWAFKKHLDENKGVFLICSHLGNIEALSAFDGGKTKTMHAFMQVSQNSVFHQFIMRHKTNKNTIIYPTENIDISIAAQMYDNLQRGDLVMMAGDRTSPNSPTRFETAKILEKNCSFPIGTFKFARTQSHPIFAICVMNEKDEKYKIFVHEFKTSNIHDMIQEYAKFLEKLVILYPKQWFNFFDFFETEEKTA